MIPNASQGKLIVLEGLDGAGTTTQARLLAEVLRVEHNIRVWTTREPSEGPIGAQIRSILARRLSMGGNTLAALFTADRLDHLYSGGGVRERLNNGEWVIMDRYYLSSFAYQALSMSEDEKRWLFAMHQFCIQPDLTVFVDVEAKTSMTRIALNRGFHFELFETEDKLLAIREQYKKAITGLCKQGEVIHVISGEHPLKTVQKNILKRVKTRFLDGIYLASDEEQKILSRKEFRILRQRVEDELHLTFQGIIERSPSKNLADATQGNAGGSYSLEFFDENAIEYHVAAFLNRNRTRITSILAQTKAEGRERISDLQKICDSVFRYEYAEQPKLLGDKK
ncbi:MAG: dTMP kinase [Chloroflexota bacterium]